MKERNIQSTAEHSLPQAEEPEALINALSMSEL